MPKKPRMTFEEFAEKYDRVTNGELEPLEFASYIGLARSTTRLYKSQANYLIRQREVKVPVAPTKDEITKLKVNLEAYQTLLQEESLRHMENLHTRIRSTFERVHLLTSAFRSTYKLTLSDKSLLTSLLSRAAGIINDESITADVLAQETTKALADLIYMMEIMNQQV